VSLPAGTRFGPYDIVSPLGAGGMGEVYRARDARLQRDVAIKVLPGSMAAVAERIARLEREARMLAALNHPNIAAIYGLEERDGLVGLVLELVEGPTLAERLARGALPVSDAIAISRQIAKALEAAHRQGIVHRDLKPANIKVREDGAVKVLDFGLAKAFDDAAAGDAALSPTITSPAMMTAAGVIIGSAAYMAPEQAKGLAADARSDIWAFGCVLYEMVTGQRAFPGAGTTETLAAVLRGDPDWTALPSDLPPATRALLMRCLEKDRGERVQDISTARFVLAEQTHFAPPAAAATIAAAGRLPRVPWIVVAAVAGIAAGAGAVTLFQRPPATALARTARFELALSRTDPPAQHGVGAIVALSPDGARLVYTALRDGAPVLVTRGLDRLETTAIAGTEGGIDPFFSPDGRQIGFVRASELRRVSVDGGPSALVWRGDPVFEGASWNEDGTIVFSHAGALLRIRFDGGEPIRIAQADTTRDELGYDRPVFLPGGATFLYTVQLRGGRNRVAARRLDGSEPTTVLEDGFGARYMAPGYLVFGQADRLMAVRFDSSALRISGTPIVLEQGVFTNNAEAVSNVTIAADGTAAFVSGSNPGVRGRPVWVDRSGRHERRIVEEPLDDPRNLRLSPDGKRLALTLGPPGQGNIWVYDVSGSAKAVPLTFRDHNTFAVWSPDGTRIAFMHVAGAAVSVAAIAADGSAAEPQPLTSEGSAGAVMDWSPRERAILLYRQTMLRLLRPPDRIAKPWGEAPYSQFGARFRPDGRWVAFTSTQSGAADIYVRPFPGPGAPIRVSSGGGHDPVWSHDGNEIFYTNGSKMMAARVAIAGAGVRVDGSRMLFDGGFRHDTVDLILRFYDVAPDGRFLMIEPSGTKASSIVVAQHWDEELKARLPK
jgi:serine/threonine-protein kinase